MAVDVQHAEARGEQASELALELALDLGEVDAVTGPAGAKGTEPWQQLAVAAEQRAHLGRTRQRPLADQHQVRADVDVGAPAQRRDGAIEGLADARHAHRGDDAALRCVNGVAVGGWRARGGSERARGHAGQQPYVVRGDDQPHQGDDSEETATPLASRVAMSAAGPAGIAGAATRRCGRRISG